MRSSSKKHQRDFTQEEEKENRPPNKQQKRNGDFYGRIFKPTRVGRQPSLSSKLDGYNIDSPQPRRGWFDLSFLYDRNGQVYVESVDGRDNLNLVDLLIDRFDDVLVPADVNSMFSENGTPVKETRTPRQRQFKHVLQVTVQAGESMSTLAFYQVPNSQAVLERRPPVYHDPSTLKPVTPPKSATKAASGRVTLSAINRNKRQRRINPSSFYHGNSANDLSRNGERNAHSHILPVSQVGEGESGRDVTVVATEGQNITQMAFENAIDRALKNLRGAVDVLYAYAEATLQRNGSGELTHIGSTQTVTYATTPGKSFSVQAKFDSQNPNRATVSLSKILRDTACHVFSSSGSSSSDVALMEVDEKEPMSPRKLDFSS